MDRVHRLLGTLLAEDIGDKGRYLPGTRWRKARRKQSHPTQQCYADEEAGREGGRGFNQRACGTIAASVIGTPSWLTMVLYFSSAQRTMHSSNSEYSSVSMASVVLA